MLDLYGSVRDCMMSIKEHPNGMLKTEPDLERYREVFRATRPDLIVECGTYLGKATRWFAETADCDVVTVDIKPQVTWLTWKEWNYRVTPFQGSSADPAVAAQVAERAGEYERVMVVLDSDHSTEHVKAELDLYAPLVTRFCYLVVEDTLVRWMPWFHFTGSPLDALDAYLEEHRGEFVVDDKLEAMSDRTQMPGGWLRRVA